MAENNKHDEIEEVPKKIEFSFDCKVSKETMDFLRKQAKELEEKENRILGIYRRVAKSSARYYLPIMEQLASEDGKLELLEEVIMKSICKGWNDCFDWNVKHIIK